MTMTKVDLTGGNNAVCRKFTRSASVSSFLMMTEMFGEETWTYLDVVVFLFSVLSYFSCLSTK